MLSHYIWYKINNFYSLYLIWYYYGLMWRIPSSPQAWKIGIIAKHFSTLDTDHVSFETGFTIAKIFDKKACQN